MILFYNELQMLTYDVIRLTRSKAAVWTADDVAHWRVLSKLKKEFLFIYLSYEYSKRLVQPVVQPAAKCKRTFSHVLMATGFFTSYSGKGEVRPQNRHTANNLSTIVAVNNLRKTNPLCMTLDANPGTGSLRKWGKI